MIDPQTRNAAVGGDWNSGPSRSAGLYGELPALPLRFPAETPVVAAPRKSRHGTRRAD
ncbi:hypothetical protein [Brevundimonas sp.]|uniref:hypothetical protein n=1 Tax=Brevundimonas sp. TaxID=1871086 RepID=UPI002737BF7F|nr:hypothetical protein [Brevundimonas sp.]MDP3803006.1 hypothetical protein [Brevundimonas sp.]